jgi:hypothetical protein
MDGADGPPRVSGLHAPGRTRDGRLTPSSGTGSGRRGDVDLGPGAVDSRSQPPLSLAHSSERAFGRPHLPISSPSR